MTKELDLLLEHIEGLGGFGDASMSHQNNSVIALEDGIWTLSERCGNWKVSFLFLTLCFSLCISFISINLFFPVLVLTSYPHHS